MRYDISLPEDMSTLQVCKRPLQASTTHEALSLHDFRMEFVLYSDVHWFRHLTNVRDFPNAARHWSARIEVCVHFQSQPRRGSLMNNVTTVGIDLAKNVFSLHAVDGRGVVVFVRR